MKNLSTLSSALSTDSDYTKWGISHCSSARLGQGYASNIALWPEHNGLAVTTTQGVWWYKYSPLTPIALWERKKGAPLFSCCTFSKDGQLFAAGGDGAKVWDVNSDECIVNLNRSQSSMHEKQNLAIDWLTFSPNGCLLAAVANEGNTNIDIWQLENGATIASYEIDNPKDLEGSAYKCIRTGPLVFSNDNRMLACGVHKFSRDSNSALNFISIWDLDTGSCIARIPISKPAHSLSFSPCGQFMASGYYDGTVQVWTIANWDEQQVYRSYGDYCMYVAYSPEGALRAAGISREQKTFSVWDMEQEQKLYTFSGDVDFLLDFSNGTQICFVSDQELVVWQTSGEEQTFHHSYITHCPFSISLVFASDQKTLAIRDFHTGVSLWNVHTPRHHPQVFKPTNGLWFSLDVSPDGKIFATSAEQNSVNLWEIGNDTPIASFTIEAKVVNVAFSPNTSILACQDEDAQIYFWDVQNKHLRDRCQAEYIDEQRMMFCPNGKYLVSGDDLLYDVTHGEKVDTFDSDEMSIHLFSHDSTQFFCDTREAIELWDIHQCEKVLSIPKPGVWNNSDVVELALSRCGKYLAGCCDEVPKELHLWTIDGGKLLNIFKGNVPILSLTFSPDNTILASSGTDGTILLWDMIPYLK